MTHLPLFDKECRGFAALTSFILTILLGWNALINADGILYVTQAHLVIEGAWHELFEHYPWPGYSILIADISYLGFSLEHAAVILNGICYALMVTGFVTVIKQAGGGRAIQWIAAIILLAHPAINGYREYIIRDVGLWGMIFWSLYALNRYHEKRQWRDIFLWTISMGIAVLFRIEAIVFLILAPFGLLIFQPRRSFLDLLHLQILFILMGAGLIALILVSKQSPELGRLTDLPKYLQGILNFADIFLHRAANLAWVFSPEMKSKHAAVALVGASVTYIIYLIIKTFTPFYLLLAGITEYKHLFPQSLTQRYIWFFIGIAAFIILTFFLQMYFLSSRYVVPIVLLFLCFVPNAVHYIAIHRGDGTLLGQKWVFPIMTLAFIAMFISGVVSFGYSKEYLRKSGEWIHQHVKPEAHVYIAEKHVAYYAQRFDDLQQWDALQAISLKKQMQKDFAGKDVVVLYHEKDTKKINDYIENHFTDKQKILFENKRHDGVTIIILNEQALLPTSLTVDTQSTP